MKRTLILLALALFSGSPLIYGQLKINEICARNETIEAPDGVSHDWIEIINTSGSELIAEGYYLSDEADEPEKWHIPASLFHPGEIKVVYAAGYEDTTAEWYAPFRIEAGVETVYLSRGSEVIHQMTSQHLEANHSQGLFPDGGSSMVAYLNATPGIANDEATAYLHSSPATVEMSHTSGVYPAPFHLHATTTHPGSVIRYTLDGSWPTASSPVWTGSMEIRDRSGEPMVHALIPTNDSWVPPLDNIRKAATLRLACFAGPFRTSTILTETYFIDPSFAERYPMPVISIQADPRDMFSDERGIYVAGDAPHGNFVHKGGAWERMATVQYFGSSGAPDFEAGCGIRIHGRSSRFYPQKSLRIYFHDEQPESGHFFPGNADDNAELESVILRAPDRLFSRALFTDALYQNLGLSLDVDAQHQKPVIVFLNGEYWGIHLISERVDEEFAAQRHGLDEDDVWMMEWDNGLYGPDEAVQALQDDLAFIQSLDPGDASFVSAVSERIDVPHFIDYACIQLALSNEDFPNNNLKIWKPLGEGKWRFILYDGDACFQHYQNDLLVRILNEEHLTDPFSVLFRSLMKNQELNALFVSTLHSLLGEELSTGKILSAWDELKQEFSPVIGEHIMRWAHPDHTGEWLDAADDIRDFAMSRIPFLIQLLADEMPSPVTVFPNPAREQLQVQLPVAAEFGSIVVQNIMGNEVHAPIVFTETGAELDIRTLDSGTYYLSVVMHQVRHTARFLVVR